MMKRYQKMFKTILKEVINPALDKLAPFNIRPSNEARVMLCAIGLQESLLKHRFQVVNGGGRGPARGLW